MKRWFCFILILLLMAPQVYADPPFEKGKGRAIKGPAQAQVLTGRAERVKGRALDEVEDAIIDELLGTEKTTVGTGMPPGLAKKGKMPPGLAKQGKTPPGWDKAKFGEGSTVEKKEGLIRGWIGKIFRRGKKSE